MRTMLVWGVSLVLLVALALGGYTWWKGYQPPALRDGAAVSPPVVVGQSVAPVASEPGIQHPIEQAPGAEAGASDAAQAGLPPPESADSFVANGLVELLGRKEAQQFLALDGFVRHAVATVDNLPQKHVAVRLWPVQPTAGRFAVEQRSDGSYLAASNAARYEPVVKFFESIDTRKAVALYVKLYPLFQKSYQELGYPGRYFNDRLVQVIDHLLQTPEPARPPKVTLPDVKGPIKPPRPWVMYEFEDLALDERSAGQKILLRMGPAHTQRVKAKLREIRGQLTREVPPPPPQQQQ